MLGQISGSGFSNWGSRLFSSTYWCKYNNHRRRINTEEKAKVVAAVLGTEFIQFLAAQAILPYRRFCRIGWIHSFLQIILVQFILFFNVSKIDRTARNWMNSVPQTTATTFAFSSVFIFLLLFSKAKMGFLFSVGITWEDAPMAQYASLGENYKIRWGRPIQEVKKSPVMLLKGQYGWLRLQALTVRKKSKKYPFNILIFVERMTPLW